MVTLEAAEGLAERDFESAGALLADAFFDNPAHVYMFPSERRRRQALAWLLQRNLSAQAPLAHSFCLAEEPGQHLGRQIVAMGFWHAPGAPSVSRRGLLRPAFLAVPFRCGLDSTRRLLEVASCLEEERRAALGPAPAWFLNNMAVARHLRGAGIGSKLLERELRTRVDPTGQLAALATQRPENVEFYRRLGFTVASERVLGSRSGSFQNWIMVREPQSQAPARGDSRLSGVR